MENLREALKRRPEACCALMLDTQGPEIHTLEHKEDKPIKLKKGHTLEICTDQDVEGEQMGDEARVSCNYEQLPSSVSLGGLVYIQDGSVHCQIIEILDVSEN